MKTTNLEAGLVRALRHAAAADPVELVQIPQIIERANQREQAHRRRSMTGGALAILLIIGVTATAVALRGETSPGPVVAMIRVPSYLTSSDSDCGAVTTRPATDEETAAVRWLPSSLPAGLVEHPSNPPTASVQDRADAGTDCWDAGATYLIPGGGMVTVSLTRQSALVSEDCVVPDDYPAMQCTKVNGNPAALFVTEPLTELRWIDLLDGEEYLAVAAGFRVSGDELLAAANALAFDGTTVTIEGYDEPALAFPRTQTDDRSVTYFGAAYRTVTDPADSPSVGVMITTWGHASVNEAGAASTVDVHGVTALLVVTGGDGTGITRWTEGGPTGLVEEPAAPHAYITWVDDGLTFRVEGPDAKTVVAVAKSLQPR